MTYVDAGHNPPIYYCAELGSVAQFRVDGVTLGAVEDITLNAWDLMLRRGELILLYTDGVTEAFNQHYEPFGMKRLINLVLAHHDLGAQELADKINQAVAELVGDREPFDAAAPVVLKRLPA